jgi:N-dimethylarginine dimethylaminohydrolase
MTDRASIELGIKSARERREKANREREAATKDLRRLCRAARKAGVPITWIAAEAGLSRQGVYDLLAEQPFA